MRASITGLTLAGLLASAAPAAAGTIAFNLDFSASQSLWAGGPSAGLDESGRTSGSVGLYYEVKANTGTVSATQNGTLSATFDDIIALGSLTTIDLQFSGDPNGGTVQSAFGASAEAGFHIDISGCLGTVVLGSCVGFPYNIDTDLAVIDEGFFLEPSTTHTPVVDTTRSASAADEVTDATAGPSIGPFTMGAQMNLDLEQRIFFTPTGLTGLVCYENVDTMAGGCSIVTIPTSGPTSLDLALGLGTWNISLLNLSLLNTFRNDINLGIRPSLNYIVGEWPPPGQSLFSFGLLDETFSLNFNEIARAGSFQVSVVDDPTPVPEPATLVLLGSGLAAAGWRARRRRASRSATRRAAAPRWG